MPSLPIHQPISLERIDRYAAGVMLASALGNPRPNAPGHYELPDGSTLDTGGASIYHRDLFDGAGPEEAHQIADAMRARGMSLVIEGYVGHEWIACFSPDGGKRVPGFRESEAKHPSLHVAIFLAALGALDAAIPPRNEAREYQIEQDHRRDLDRVPLGAGA